MVQVQEFDTGILGGELPVDGQVQGIAIVHLYLAFDAPVQTLRGQGGDLDFGDVESVAVLGRVVPLQPGRNALRLSRRKGLVEHVGMMRVEVIANQNHLLGLREMHVHQIAQDRATNQVAAEVVPSGVMFTPTALNRLVHAETGTQGHPSQDEPQAPGSIRAEVCRPPQHPQRGHAQADECGGACA